MRFAVALILASAPAHADRGERFDGVTLALQTGSGAAAGGVLGGAGALIGAYVAKTVADDGLPFRRWGHVRYGALIGGAVGWTTGVIGGVYLSGHRRDGTGSAVAAWLGAVTGLGTWFGLEVIWQWTGHDTAVVDRLAVGAGAMLVGALIGYHLSADAKADPSARFAIPILTRGF